MKTMLTLTLTASMFQLLSSHHMLDSMDRFTEKFTELRDWCIIQLDVGTWEMSKLDTLTSSDSIAFTHVFTFYNPEDATAFRLIFDL